MGTCRQWMLVIVIAFGTVTACDKSPTGPTLPPGTGGPTPSTTPPTVRLELVGPESVAPGEQAQFTAIGHRSDGSTEDVTQRVIWNSFRTNILTVAGGRVSGVSVGDTTLQARLLNLLATREVIVVPTGTYRVAGIITEGDSPSTPLSAVRVDVQGNPSIAPAQSFGDGRYRLYGVAGPARIRAEKAGYQTVVQDLVVGAHATANFELSLSNPRQHVSGQYTLTVAAAAECRDNLPEEAWTRRYAATLHQQGPLLRAELSGAAFVVVGGRGNSFDGRVEPSGVTFYLASADYYFFYRIFSVDLVEELSPPNYLIVEGFATLTGSTDTLDGALNGAFSIYDQDPRRFPRVKTRCQSTQHRFTLRR